MTLKLLLVGKEKVGFEPIKSAFENEDIDVIVATSIGLALFLARKNQPNLIISQQELTDSNADRFFNELKSEEALAAIPFVLVTSIYTWPLSKETNFSTIDLRNKILTFMSK